jgi:hypothetical protein
MATVQMDHTGASGAPFGPPRAWTRDSLAADGGGFFYDIKPETRDEIADALGRVDARGLDLQSVEAQDFRLPSFAVDVPGLRRRLDDGPGFVVVRGLGVESMRRADADVVYWGIANYLGRVIRQNLTGARLDTVSDKGADRWDPYRLVDTNDRFDTHSDNAFLEPRAPDYLGLCCYRQAKEGGASLLLNAHAVHNEILAAHPQWLARLYQIFHHDLPSNQHLPDGPPTKAWPIFEERDGDLVMHFLRIYIDPGMETAGCPLTDEERAMLDFIDDLTQREDLLFEHRLNPGEALFNNNRWLLHGRRSFIDAANPEAGRLLARTWMWRRHLPPGEDPVDLDAAEFGPA